MPQASGPFSGIFICYRRDDSSGYARALFERLGAHFGDGQIFMDLDHIEPGEDFAQVIEGAVGSCEILLALIGRNWLTNSDEAGRRLDNPNDFVRLEIAAALARGIRIIPVLVQSAHMPRPQDLPEDLVPLSRRHALELSDQRWKHDVDQLIGVLERTLSRQREARRIAAQEEAEQRRRRENDEWQREAESGRLRQEAEEAGRLARDGRRAESGVREAEEVERAPRGSAPVMTGGAAHTANPGGRAARYEIVERAAAQAKRLGPRLVIAIAGLASLVAGTLLIRPLVSGWGDGRSPAVPSPTAAVTPATPSLSAPQPPSNMVYVPGGQFTMGSDAGDEHERPAHQEMVAPFFIDKYEVTNQEYAEFVAAKNWPPPPTWNGNKTFPPGAGSRPVTGVKWGDAVAYAAWVGKRLPTEVEWELAARGKDGWRYPWGNEWSAGLANAVKASNKTADVGSYKGASPFGAFDMVGNAWEWTSSKLAPYPGGMLPADIPQPADALRVIRGGSYTEDETRATTTYRGYLYANSRNNEKTGFRCARDAGDRSGQ